ncbi:MAG: tRNA-dihydrouridine synthase [Planctomycetia bacterium]|nr:tRNA-dihydrouridine synthase [Planctomycetia bacterium]
MTYGTFSPLQIGSLKIGLPLLQAPLSGYSDAPMRRLARKFGASFAFCEVFLDQFVINVSKKSKARLYLAVKQTDKPSGAQLMGSSSEEFVPAALKLLECGFDLIDLNFACPVKKVLGRSRGGFLISEPQRAIEIAQNVRNAIPAYVPLTAKLRKGYDDSQQSRLDFYQLLDGLIDAGLNGVAVHGRTVLQRYQGVADWNFLREVKEYVAVKRNRPDFTVIGCGDLFQPQEICQKLLDSGVDGVALARGAIGNPWLFTQTRAAMLAQAIPPMPTLAQQRATIAEHFNAAMELYGHNRAPTVMRKFGVAYSKLHPEQELVRVAFAKCKTPKEWFQILDQFYGSQVDDSYLKYLK